jgi:hypothetical protein
MAVYSDLYAEQGADFSVAIDVESINTFSGENTDLDDFDFSGQARRSFAATEGVDFNFLHDETTEGKLYANIASSVTSTMKAGRWVYDIFCQNTNTGIRQKVLEGLFILEPSATRVPIE